MDAAIAQGLRRRLDDIYGPAAEGCLPGFLRLVEQNGALARRQPAGWDQRDIVFITYADQIRAPGQRPLRALRDFLADHGLEHRFSTVHLLPFYPSTSDDGFSVVDYRAVDPALGDWPDVRELGRTFQLMFDLVLNHVSQQSPWFQAYLAGDARYADFFCELDPAADLSAAARPRSSPVWSEFLTSRGPRRVWTTFSADQIDLNYREPEVLRAIAEVLCHYVRQGARIVRLDAVAYLWKEIGTSCIHRPQTHAVVKFLRELLAHIAPQVWLLTETNVPHAENVSYFGSGDEAHMVYQFSLPPLMLDAFLLRDAGPLVAWLAALAPAPSGTTYLNFTASHDGVGLRPLEGLVSMERRQRLIDAAVARGGLISTRRSADGRDAPYELNLSYFDALGEPGGMDPRLHARRFLATQALMLAMRGVPAVYFHSLVGSPNDMDGVRESGQARRINRRKFDRRELDKILADKHAAQKQVFDGYRHLLATRVEQPAFHPDAAQEVWRLPEPGLIAFVRTSIDARQRILVVANVSDHRQVVHLGGEAPSQPTRDLLSHLAVSPRADVELAPGQVAWLEESR